MKIWIGKTIMVIGGIHTLFGFAFLGTIFQDLLADGLFNSVHGQFDREFFFWFIFFGIVLIFLGALMDWTEAQIGQLPRWLAWSLLAMTIVMVAIMPISGAWLMLIPVIGMFRRFGKRKNAKT